MIEAAGAPTKKNVKHAPFKFPEFLRSLNQEKIDLSAIDHGYDPATRESLDIKAFGEALTAADHGAEPLLFNIPSAVTISFYEPDIRVKRGGDSRRLVPITTTRLDDLMIEVLPAAKAIIFANIGSTRAIDRTLGQMEDLGSDRATSALKAYRSTFSSIIDHPNEEDRVNLHQGDLHVASPKRPNLGSLQLETDFIWNEDQSIHFVYRSNSTRQVLRRFILSFDSPDTQIQKLNALKDYRAGFYEHSNFELPQKGQLEEYSNTRITQGFRSIGKSLDLVPEDFVRDRVEVMTTRMGQELHCDNLGTAVAQFRDPKAGVEMLARVHSPHSIYASIQQLFIAPEGLKVGMKEVSNYIEKTFPSYVSSFVHDDVSTLEVSTKGESMLLAYEIAAAVFEHSRSK